MLIAPGQRRHLELQLLCNLTPGPGQGAGRGRGTFKSKS